MPKVSIVVPVYNVEKYLRRCLDTLVSQTLEDIEIICVNDGSTDSSLQILEEYAKKDNRVVIVTQVNGGLSDARNTGLAYVTGEFIGFVDSDDYIEEKFYEKLYNAAKSENAEIACCGIIRENRRKLKELVKFEDQVVCRDINKKFSMLKVPEHCYVWNKIYKTDKLKELDLKFKKGLIYEDMPFTADVLTQMGDIVCVPEIKYHYWIHKGSIIKNSETDKARADKIYAKNYILKKCLEYGVKNLSEKDYLVCKRECYFLGIKLLKVYQYRATKKIYLFGLFHLLTIKEYV